MCPNQNQNPFHSEILEKWLESFFLDPITTMEDQTNFRVDLFDSDTELIIEAMIPNFISSEVTVYLENTQVIIRACKSNQHKKERTVNFPFTIASQKVSASFSNETLEIIISKIHQEKPKNRIIPLSK